MPPIDILKSIFPKDITSYLKATGWKEEQKVRDGLGAVWIREDSPEGPSLLVPLDLSLGDYLLRVEELLLELTEFEHRSWEEIVHHLKTLRCSRTTHELKIWPENFMAVTHPDKYRRKTVEVRKDDRGYQTGDVLVLREWDPQTETYTGRQARALVTHVLRGWGLQERWVAMSILLSEK